MKNNTPNIQRINDILQKTIGFVEDCKEEIVAIVEQARNEVKRTEQELNAIKEQVQNVAAQVDRLEIEEKKSRAYLI